MGGWVGLCVCVCVCVCVLCVALEREEGDGERWRDQTDREGDKERDTARGVGQLKVNEA